MVVEPGRYYQRIESRNTELFHIAALSKLNYDQLEGGEQAKGCKESTG